MTSVSVKKPQRVKNISWNEKNLLQVGASELASMVLSVTKTRKDLRLRVHAIMVAEMIPHGLAFFLKDEVRRVPSKLMHSSRSEERMLALAPYLDELSTAIVQLLGGMDAHEAFDVLTDLLGAFKGMNDLRRWGWFLESNGKDIKGFVHWHRKASRQWVELAQSLGRLDHRKGLSEVIRMCYNMTPGPENLCFFHVATPRALLEQVRQTRKEFVPMVMKYLHYVGSIAHRYEMKAYLSKGGYGRRDIASAKQFHQVSLEARYELSEAIECMLDYFAFAEDQAQAQAQAQHSQGDDSPRDLGGSATT